MDLDITFVLMLDAINLEFGFWKTNLSLNILYRLRQTLWQVDATFLLTKLEKENKDANHPHIATKYNLSGT